MNVYDFDGTIYDGDSSVDFYRFAVKKNPRTLVFLPKQLWGFFLYAIRKISKTELKSYFFSFLSAIDTEATVSAFWQVHAHKIFPWYKKQQALTDVVISASPDFLLRPICRQMGIRRLIASVADPATGIFLRKNCHGEEKVRRFQEECSSGAVQAFYSDSLSDSPMAAHAERAYLVTDGTPGDWPQHSMTSNKYRPLLLYLIFGVCTVAINAVVYSICCSVFQIKNIPSAVLAWSVAVVFAFFTNKHYVFTSKDNALRSSVQEGARFFLCRVLSGSLDIAIMAIAVSWLHGSNILWKLISNVIVTIANYWISKLWIFTNSTVKK